MKNGANGNPHPRHLAFYSLGFFRKALRTRLEAMGFVLTPFGIGKSDAVVVWGRKSVAKRGFKAALRKGLRVLTVEDGFIRSIEPGWQEAPRSLNIDAQGVYFDITQPSDLAEMLQNPPPQNAQAQLQMELQVKLGISKYNAVPRGNWNKSGYVLVIDQVKDDQSIIYGQAGASDFKKALDFAKNEYPDDEILIRAHPSGGGYYEPSDFDARTSFCTENVNPFDLIENAKAIIAVTSQFGFDAILAGTKPHIFGMPFYAGLGLTDDHKAEARGQISQAQLFDVVINQYGNYFAQDGSPSDALTQIFALHDERSQIEKTKREYNLHNMRAWKRPHMKRFFPHQSSTGQRLVWGQREREGDWIVEDGFLRSEGLGAKLVPPLSLVMDRQGIYFDPNRPSDLEDYIHARKDMHPLEIERAQNLCERIITKGISKYNLQSEAVHLPSGKPVLLVVGQVENDQSIKLGATGEVKTNAALLKRAKADHPDHFILYKPHPDVMAGLRDGTIEADDADMVYEGAGIESLWPHIDALATITSLSGFEALLRGKSVSCYGMPFYADWGLTRDFAPQTGRRGQASLDALIYASLIDYPLYLDPKTQSFTTAEVIIDRIANHQTRYPLYLQATTWTQQKYYRARDYFKNRSKSN